MLTVVIKHKQKDVFVQIYASGAVNEVDNLQKATVFRLDFDNRGVFSTPSIPEFVLRNRNEWELRYIEMYLK